jgi:hypothetical protein
MQRAWRASFNAEDGAFVGARVAARRGIERARIE